MSLQINIFQSSLADPHHVDADPDPACHFDADPVSDPTFQLIHVHADPDPQHC